jgi:hypothetical protein
LRLLRAGVFIAPKNYIREFEKLVVRVSRVRYQPGDKMSVHEP